MIVDIQMRCRLHQAEVAWPGQEVAMLVRVMILAARVDLEPPYRLRELPQVLIVCVSLLFSPQGCPDKPDNRNRYVPGKLGVCL